MYSRNENFRGHVSKHGRMAIWLLYLFIGYLISRGWCVVDLPNDCNYSSDINETFNDLITLIIMGFILGWLINITEERRFWTIFTISCIGFEQNSQGSNLLENELVPIEVNTPLLPTSNEINASRRCCWEFHLLYFSTPIVFSALNEIPSFQSSLSSNAHISPALIITYSIVGVIVILVIGWHLRYAYLRYPLRNFLTSSFTRIIIFTFCCCYVYLMQNAKEEYLIHIHHYIIAWALAIFGEFNHRISLCYLSITTGIFIQGLGAYGRGVEMFIKA